jgi:hypothetical protein
MPPPRGQFVLRPMANPPLKAGDYTLQGQVRLDKNVPNPSRPQDPPAKVSVGDVERQDTHIRVTAPRYRLPADQMLSVFPPANSVGSYENRLPQIVIKRRTLPWEREAAAGDLTTPWLALVVVAEGEATLSPEQPAALCVTPGITLAGPNDVATGVCLQVTPTVIDKIFPKREEVPLLCHVREVDVNDTELANGDDDGFLAVVIANRLPQYDRRNNKPVRYLACLINLEQQLDKLAKPPPPVLQFDAVAMVFDYRALVAAPGAPGSSADHVVMGTALGGATNFTAALRARAVGIAQGAATQTKVQAAAGGAAQAGQAAQWKTTTAQVEKIALTSAQNDAGRLVRDGMLAGYRGNLAQIVTAEPVLRFPVLAHWSFTVGEAGGFESLMRDLDVAMLGSDPPPPRVSSNEPPTRPAIEIGPTGHVGLPHLTRLGDRVKAWYRGPLTPFPTERDRPDAQGRLPLPHVSDQLRRSIPDGREDLSLAAAFEIGRLLALSQPSVVRAQIAWRGEAFGKARANALAGEIAKAPVLQNLLRNATGSLADMLSRHMVLQAAAQPSKVLAATRPLAVPGRELPFAKEGGLDRLIAEGFGLSVAAVKKARDVTGTVAALKQQAVPLAQSAVNAPVLEGLPAVRLNAVLDDSVDRLTAGAIGRPNIGTHETFTNLTHGGLGPRSKKRGAKAKDVKQPDALDALIDQATRRKQGDGGQR